MVIQSLSENSLRVVLGFTDGAILRFRDHFLHETVGVLETLVGFYANLVGAPLLLRTRLNMVQTVIEKILVLETVVKFPGIAPGNRVVLSFCELLHLVRVVLK